MISLFCRLLGWLTYKLVPRRTKRMLLLMGVASQAINLENDDSIETNEYLRDINALFKLAATQDSLRFAIEVGQILWADLKYHFSGNVTDIERLTREIIDLCPESLRYADDKQMEEEILQTLKFAYGHA